MPVIRQYSDNLILVGNRQYDQNPQEAIGNTVSGENIAYTFHYYANSHNWEGSYEWGDCEGTNAQKAIDAGLSVFVSEWGTANADGGGNPDQSRNTSWQNWMDKNQLSWANWSASKVSEGTAAFEGSSNKNSLQYTTSGNLVKGYLATNPTSYTKCPNGGNDTPIFVKAEQNSNVTFSDNALHIAGAPATVEIYTMKGDKLMAIDNVSGALSLAKFPAGKYFARIQKGSSKMVRAFQIK